MSGLLLAAIALPLAMLLACARPGVRASMLGVL